MKFKISHLFLVAFIALFTACSSDDEPKPTQVLVEETPIAKDLVFDNIIVEGATKRTGEPNISNGEISFTLNKENTSAVMIDGFDVEFSSNDNIVGAYLQIKDTEGNLADGYYDIDLSKVSDKKKAVIRKNRTHSINQLLKHTEQKNVRASVTKVVDINFKAAIKPGIFCYLIRVYDAAGNLSPFQEVCITVQSWGGNDDLAAKWNLTKTEGSKDTINVGIENCHIIASHLDTLRNCNPKVSANYNKCFTVDSTKYTISSDGTYKHEIYNTDKSLDDFASMSACELIDKEEKEHFLYKGSWAYDQQKNELIIVELEATTIDESGVETTEIYTIGEAKIAVFKSNVSGSNLTLTNNADASNKYTHFLDKE